MLQKQNVPINFSQGMDTKSDPNQLQIGKFVYLKNAVFDKIGRLSKRNGYAELSALPDDKSTFVTTFNGNLTAFGEHLFVYNHGSDNWLEETTFTTFNYDTLPLIRNNLNQTRAGVAVSNNGLVCVTFTEQNVVGSTAYETYKYALVDSETGQSIVAPTQITSTYGTVSGSARVFNLGNYFILVFGAFDGASYHLQYKSISINNLTSTGIGAATDVTDSYTPATTKSFDGIVSNNNLYLSWNGASQSGIKTAYLDQYLNLTSTVVIGSNTASIISVTSDETQTSPIIWTTSYIAGSNSGYVVATNQNLSTIFSSRQFISSSTAQLLNITTTARQNTLNIFSEVSNYYTYGTASSVASNYIIKQSVNSSGSASAKSVVTRSVGLGSKACFCGTTSYFLTTYQSANQSTYFLQDENGNVRVKLAYGNGGGYVTTGLSSFSLYNDIHYVGYLAKNLVQAVNKDTNVAAGTQTAGIYSQTGVNLAKIHADSEHLCVAEIANNLHTNCGFLWNYDGYSLNENNFFLYPDNIVLVPRPGGNMTAQTYYYQVTYEWSDNQGLIHRSAPSLPVSITNSNPNNSVIINVPTLRLTYKTSNPVKIAIYRWSTAQPVYYKCTSITSPVLNDTTIDSVQFIDTSSDAQILGNELFYTTGGVLENTNGPAFDHMTIFDNRLWGIEAENKNVLWYSKEIIQNVPVEMSSLLTYYVPPTTSTNVSTGACHCLSVLDDKLIIFKKNAMYYMNGRGPDNTGANSQYSQPILIHSTIGSDVKHSIVLTPNGLMFQSDKGIWLLGRDLSTQYIGAPVEAYNHLTVLSAVCVPGTNEVRFNLEDGTTLMYDYYVNQWSVFDGISGLSSTIFENLHTYIDKYGRVFQETQGKYLDGSSPVLMSFKTGWLNLAGLQGYQRIYRMYLLGDYKTPHRITIGAAYDFEPSITQYASFIPDNYSAPWGIGSTWGSISVWGGKSSIEQFQVNFAKQQCQSIQLTFDEYYDSSIGVVNGAGLTVSGLNLVAGMKKGYPRNIGPKNKVG